MDVIQILVFLGIIGWGLFQVRTQKQKKPKRVKTVRQAPPAASFSVEEEHEISLKEMCESIFGEAESSGEPYFDVELHYEEYYVDNRKKLKN